LDTPSYVVLHAFSEILYNVSESINGLVQFPTYSCLQFVSVSHLQFQF